MMPFEEERPEEPGDAPRERRPETVMRAVGRVTGEEPRVLLRDSDSEQIGSPYVDPKSAEAKLLPQGRGNYQILGEIARGGMGVILKGRDTDLGRDVAIKVLDERLLHQPAVLQRFVEEAQIGGQLQHPGIVPVYEVGLMADERPYFTMKLVKGRTLSALLSKRKSVEAERRRFLSIFEAICQTVAYAHSKGVIHRDLKPANVMVGAFGEIQVVDWGLAKVLAGGGVADELIAKQSRFTVIATVRSGPGSSGSDSVVGSVMGTPAYMAPEQAIGEVEKVDERADVFALGAILCELITGEPPYVAAEKERTVVLAAHAKLDPARARIDACHADTELRELCLECLSPAPAARPQNAEEVAQRVHDYLASLEEKAHKAELAATEAREGRRRLRLTLALASTVVIAIVAIGFMVRRTEKQREAQRQERLAGELRAMDDAQAQVLDLQEQGRLGEALEVARASLALLGDDADPDLRERADRQIAAVQTRVEERDRRRQVELRNAALLARCEELRMRQIEAGFGFSPRNLNETIDEDYATAFREYGIDLSDADVVAALETLRASGIGVEAALALDDWASVRRVIYGFDSFDVESVLALAFDMDPDPLRTDMRAALLANDAAALLELARSELLDEMPASSFWVLIQGLLSVGQDEVAFEVTRRGVEAHPGDFLLNFKLGDLYGTEEHHVLAIEYLAAARALRPENGAVHALLADAYNNLRDSPRAKDAYLECYRLNPALDRILRYAGWEAFRSGDLETAVQMYDRVNELFQDSQWQFEGDLTRSFLGRVPMSELADRVRVGEVSFVAGYTAWGLTYHPDPDQRDLERAIELVRPLNAEDFWGIAGRTIEAAALLQLGRPEDALALLAEAEGYGRNPPDMIRGLVSLERAWAHALLGNAAAARRYFELAEESVESYLYDGWEPWQGSALQRTFHEVRELVGT